MTIKRGIGNEQNERQKSLLDVVKSNNLEILKIDLFNDFELFVREGTRNVMSIARLMQH